MSALQLTQDAEPYDLARGLIDSAIKWHEDEERAALRRLTDWELGAEAEYLARESGEAVVTVTETTDIGPIPCLLAGWWKRRLQLLAAEGERRIKLRERVVTWPSTPDRWAADFPQQIKDRMNGEDLRDFLEGRFTLHLRRRGTTYVARCPFHNDRTPSFTLYADHWYCFGCAAGGDVFAFLMLTGMSFREAVESVAGYLGVALPAHPSHGRADAKPTAIDHRVSTRVARILGTAR